jgi:hypothetical protein
MSLSHNDQIAPKIIENGVAVPAGLQVGEMTLKEHQDYLVWQKMQRPLTRHEAIAAGHRPNEVHAYFGPLSASEERHTPAKTEVLGTEEFAEFKGAIKLVPELKPIPRIAQSPANSDVVVEISLSRDDGGVVEVFRDQKSTPSDYAESRARGYTGDACDDCGMFTMVHNGTCLVCDNCGRTTGCS